MIKPAARAVFFTSLGVWVGGMATLAFVVAPTLFGTLQSRPMAGTIFGAVLRAFGPLEFALGGAAGLALVALWRAGELDRSAGALRMCALGLMLSMTLVGHVVLLPAIEHERSAVPQFDQLPPGVPARARFEALHRESVWLASATLLIGAALLARSAATSRPSHGA